MSRQGTNLETLFRQNAEVRDAVTPYLSKYTQFNWISIPLGSTVPQPLPDFSAEFIMISARRGNAGAVNVWNQSLTGAEGITLLPADSMVLIEDNQAWDVAEALARVMGKENPIPRRAIRTGDWYVCASGATQIVDVLMSFGPQL